MNITIRSAAMFVVAASTAVASATGCSTRHEREIVITRNVPAQQQVVVQRPPMPAPRVEMRTIAPGPNYRWVEGRYQWNGNEWEWSPGYWAP